MNINVHVHADAAETCMYCTCCSDCTYGAPLEEWTGHCQTAGERECQTGTVELLCPVGEVREIKAFSTVHTHWYTDMPYLITTKCTYSIHSCIYAVIFKIYKYTRLY